MKWTKRRWQSHNGRLFGAIPSSEDGVGPSIRTSVVSDQHIDRPISGSLALGQAPPTHRQQRLTTQRGMKWLKIRDTWESGVQKSRVRYRATLTRWRMGDFAGKWEWHLHPSADTMGLFAGASDVCATKREAVAALKAEATRVFELVEQVHGPDGPPAEEEF